MTILKDHYESCELDKSNMYKNGNPHSENYSTICSETTQYSFIIQLRSNMPVEIGTLMWLTFYRPCNNLYAPIYLGINEFPGEFAYTNSDEAIKYHLNPNEKIFEKNSLHAYWNFVSATDFVNQNFGIKFPSIKNKNEYLQYDLIRRSRIFEENILKIYSENPNQALELVDKYSGNSLKEIKNYAIEIIK